MVLPWFGFGRSAAASEEPLRRATPSRPGEDQLKLTDALLQEDGHAVAAIDTAVELVAVCELSELFPALETASIERAVRRSNGDVNLAAEILAREGAGSTLSRASLCLWRRWLLDSKDGPLRREALVEAAVENLGPLVHRVKIEKFVVQTWSDFGLDQSTALTFRDFLALLGAGALAQLGSDDGDDICASPQRSKVQVMEATTLDGLGPAGNGGNAGGSDLTATVRTLLTAPRRLPADTGIEKSNTQLKGGAVDTGEDKCPGQHASLEKEGKEEVKAPYAAPAMLAGKGKGKAKGPPPPMSDMKGKGKVQGPGQPATMLEGKGKNSEGAAMGPDPTPPTSDAGAVPDVAPNDAVCRADADLGSCASCSPGTGGKAGKSKGPGPAPAGKGKGPPVPPQAAESGSSTHLGAAASGNSQPPKKVEDQTSGPFPWPMTGCKGGPSAPPRNGKAGGKGPPPSGGGKGKVSTAAAAPTRCEKDDWACKIKNNLRWQRRVSGQGGIEESVFRTGEEAVNLEALADLFATDHVVEARGSRTLLVSPEKIDKPILWEPTEKQDAKKRRTNIGILMKTWEKLAEPFLDRLKLLEFGAIVSDSAFNEDLFEQLIDMVKGIGGVEWTRLREEDAETKYEWGRSIEGFFKRLQAIPCFKERLLSLHRHRMIERDLGKLEKRTIQLDSGMRAIRNSDALKVVMRKLLRIGNCLNAGSGSLGRADGFDTVQLLERTLLIDMPKACDGKTSLLQYIKDRELDSTEREAFWELQQRLLGWRIPSGKEDGPDPTDLNELEKDAGVLTDQLSRLEGDLDQIRRQLESAGHGSSSPQQLARELAVLSGYLDAISACRRRTEGLKLQEVRENLLLLQRYLMHVPPEKKKFSAGKILGIMAELARKLAERKEPGKKEATGGAARSSSVAPPTPHSRRSSRGPARRRSASVDSVVTLAAPREPSREPAKKRPSVLAQFSPFRLNA